MFAVSYRATERGIQQRAALRTKPVECEIVRNIEDIRRERQERELQRHRAEMAKWIRQNDERRAKEAQQQAWDSAIAKYRVIEVRKVKRPVLPIIEKVAAFHNLTVEHILGASRSRVVIEARFDAIKAVADARPDLSSAQLGKVFGRDHTTIFYALKQRGGRALQEPAQ